MSEPNDGNLDAEDMAAAFELGRKIIEGTSVRLKPARHGPPVEAEILRDVRAWLAKQPDIVIHRNNTGRLPDVNGRTVTFGLAIGSSDLIGSLNVIVRGGMTPKDPFGGVVKVIARALAIEVKTATGRLTEDQERFLAHHEAAGWITGVVRSVEDVERLIGRARRWEL